MRIGIDAHVLGARAGGVERVVHEIVSRVPSLLPRVEFTAYVRRGYQPLFPPRATVRYVVLPWSEPMIQRTVILPVLARRHRLDLLHVQRIAVGWSGCRTLVQVHDLLPLTHPGEHAGLRHTIVRACTPTTLRQACHVLTGSAAAAAEITALFPGVRDRTTAVWNAVDHAVFHPTHEPGRRAELEQRFSLSTQPFFLYAGAITPRKNLPLLIRAFAAVRRDRAPDAQLVLAGIVRTAGHRVDLERLIRELGLADAVRLTGYVHEADYVDMLRHARWVVAASLGEGFDLPALEAMACGTPVIASDIPVHREVLGDAAIFFPRHDADSLAAVLGEAWTDEVARAAFARRGLERAAGFHWQAMAESVARLYERLLRETPRR